MHTQYILCIYNCAYTVWHIAHTHMCMYNMLHYVNAFLHPQHTVLYVHI